MQLATVVQRCGAASSESCSCHADRGALRRAELRPGPHYAPPGVYEVLASSGEGLEATVRLPMESRFKRDFSMVRVHADSSAAESSRVVGARAYTVGHHLVFAAGQYQPATSSGLRLLAHELAHVAQQGPDTAKSVIRQGGMITVGNVADPLEADAERAADAAVTVDPTLKSEGLVRKSPEPSRLLQRTIGDGHDLHSPRFKGEIDLEAAYDGELVIELGDTGPAVVKIQHALVDAGYMLPLFSVDGKFGGETKSAVVAFQTDKGLALKDGRVGPATMAALDARFPSLAPLALPPGPWTVGCVLDTLCRWNRPVVDQLTRTTVKVADRIFWEDPFYDGTSWTTQLFEGGGQSSTTAREIGLLSGASCVSAAETIYHEVWHQNQPTSFGTEARETGAYRFTEQWLIYEGLPGDTSLRTTDPVTGVTVVNLPGVTALVRTNYPGPTGIAGDEVIGRTGAGDTIVQRPDRTTYTRAPVRGDKYPGPMHVVAERVVPAASWVCPVGSL